MDDDVTGNLRQGEPEEAQHFYPDFPSISGRPARAVRVKPAISRGVSIVWAAALIAVGLAPTAVMADEGHGAAVPALHGATDVQGIGASTKGGAASKADPALYALHGEYQTYLQTSDAHTRGPSGFTSRNPLARIAEGYVVIDTAAKNDPKALASDLETLGLEDVAVFGRMVSGRLSLTAVPALENLDSLRFARPAYAMTLVGSVTSQGDAAMRADIARNAFAVNGTGVTVRPEEVRETGAIRVASSAKGPRQIQFGSSVTNVPPGTIGNVPLTLPKRIRNFIRKTEKKTIRAQMQIRSAAGTAIETRRIRIRLK